MHYPHIAALVKSFLRTTVISLIRQLSELPSALLPSGTPRAAAATPPSSPAPPAVRSSGSAGGRPQVRRHTAAVCRRRRTPSRLLAGDGALGSASSPWCRGARAS